MEVQELAFPLNSQEKIVVESADISTGGLKVICNRLFAVGDKVRVKVYIPSFNKLHAGFLKAFESDLGQYLQAVAEVVWISEVIPHSRYETGMKFLDVYEDDWHALRKLILQQRQI
ncbi:MAG: PilZ domain-containing protein [Desulfonatronovibrio sp.]